MLLLYVWLVKGLAGGYRGKELLILLVVMLVGHLISTIVGATIGVASKNQMMATSLTVPIMMIFSFLPMLSMFNESIMKKSKYIFTEQLFVLINNVSNLRIDAENTLILAVNLVLASAIFSGVYRKSFGK